MLREQLGVTGIPVEPPAWEKPAPLDDDEFTMQLLERIPRDCDL